jgi:hypothetical protein
MSGCESDPVQKIGKGLTSVHACETFFDSPAMLTI